MDNTRARVTIGQSADPDDAFMAWGLEAALGERGIDVELVFGDIETLNRRAVAADIDLTALSVGAYPTVAADYRLLRCGASFGEDYGPVVVGRHRREPGVAACQGLRIAIPGELTTATMLLRIYAGDSCETVVYPFDAIIGAVEADEVDAGLVIHEGQLVYDRLGLHCLFEPAAEWSRCEQLPVPLGVVAVRRNLPFEQQRTLADGFLDSVRRGFEHPQAALEFAARYARGLDRPTLEEYVHRYVDAATLDMGQAGEKAIRRLFEQAVQAGLLAEAPAVDLL